MAVMVVVVVVMVVVEVDVPSQRALTFGFAQHALTDTLRIFRPVRVWIFFDIFGTAVETSPVQYVKR